MGGERLRASSSILPTTIPSQRELAPCSNLNRLREHFWASAAGRSWSLRTPVLLAANRHDRQQPSPSSFTLRRLLPRPAALFSCRPSLLLHFILNMFLSHHPTDRLWPPPGNEGRLLPEMPGCLPRSPRQPSRPSRPKLPKLPRDPRRRSRTPLLSRLSEASAKTTP